MGEWVVVHVPMASVWPKTGVNNMDTQQQAAAHKEAYYYYNYFFHDTLLPIININKQAIYRLL